jgi:zinc transport system substrate-binding protein
MCRRLVAVFTVFLFWISIAPAFAQQLTVAVTIEPLGAIASNVMAGAGQPDVLIPTKETPQTFVPTAKQKQVLKSAQVVVWIGPPLEKSLAKIIAALPRTAHVITVSRLPGIKLLPSRPAGIWSQAGTVARAPAGKSAINPNLWLDPANAAVIARAIQQALSSIDPNDAAVYHANADSFDARLQALEYELDATLTPVRKIPFLVMHDSYAYLDQTYRLNNVGTVIAAPGKSVSPSRAAALKAAIERLHVHCIFSEPQYRPATAAKLAEGLGVHISVLDSYGSGVTPGPSSYFAMMSRLAGGIAGCLSSP